MEIRCQNVFKLTSNAIKERTQNKKCINKQTKRTEYNRSTENEENEKQTEINKCINA